MEDFLAKISPEINCKRQLKVQIFTFIMHISLILFAHLHLTKADRGEGVQVILRNLKLLKKLVKNRKERYKNFKI